MTSCEQYGDVLPFSYVVFMFVYMATTGVYNPCCFEVILSLLNSGSTRNEQQLPVSVFGHTIWRLSPIMHCAVSSVAMLYWVYIILSVREKPEQLCGLRNVIRAHFDTGLSRKCVKF